MIDYLAGVERLVVPAGLNESARIGPKFFDGAEPFTDVGLTHGGLNFIADHDLTPRDVRWPLDVKIIIPQMNAIDGGGADWSLNRYRSLDARTIRGRVSPALPHPVEWTIGWPAGGACFRNIFGYAGPRRWVNITKAGNVWKHTTDDRAEFSERVQLALELWQLRPQQWRVYFALDDKPGVELPTDPLGAQEAFRLRDIPDGRERRTALRHWVTEHWRADRTDPGVETKVREHLRGANQFSWGGLNCRITPSLIDLDRADDAREQRQLDRVNGTDRRRVG